MSVYTGPYVGAKSCTGGPSVGARALMAWYVGAYGKARGTNLGIYNCRAVRGGSTTSLHGEGRAADLGTPSSGQDWSQALADLLVAYSAELGIQCVIHRRRIWSSTYAAQGWRPYTGVAAHYDHIHVEFTWDAARTLTAARVQQILGDPSPIKGDGTPAPGPAPTPAPAGPGIQAVQDRLNGLGFGPLVADGVTGPKTIAATKRFQRAAGIKADGDFGPVSWETSNRVPAYPGEDARAFQQRLADRGWPIRVDGAWGPKSKATLRSFQAEKGLDADGTMGPQSWTALWTRAL